MIFLLSDAFRTATRLEPLEGERLRPYFPPRRHADRRRR